jgi:hypothetical protein
VDPANFEDVEESIVVCNFTAFSAVNETVAGLLDSCMFIEDTG